MGFDNECILHIQNLAGEYFCPVCRMLVYPNEALQSQCTHLYCKPCLTYIVATTRACPYDGYLVTHEDSKPLFESNKTLAETIDRISVHCLYHRSGCTWQGPLSDCQLHCSACTFGNSPVVCNRCALQIVHSQVQEHAQTCPGVPPQGQSQTDESTRSSAVSTSTNQMPSNMQGATASSQAHSSYFNAALIPGQIPDQPINLPPFTQAALMVSNLPHQQQHYQQYAGYEPYQQHYQQLYQHQELIQQSHLHPRPQVQCLPPEMTNAQVQTFQPPSVIHAQPPAQQYPQSHAISVTNQLAQSHPLIAPQSHIHLQSHTFAQPLTNQPRPHPHSQSSQLQPRQLYMSHCQQNLPHVQPRPQVQIQQNSQVHPHAYPLRANVMHHYPSINHKHLDHLYHLQSQSDNPQQPLGYPISQEGHNQQHQCALQNQITQSLINPTELQQINQQNHWLMISSSENQIVPTAAQPNLSHHEHPHILHDPPPVQASGKPLTPQHQEHQEVAVTKHTLMHSKVQSNVKPPFPLQNAVLAQHEPPHQSQSEISGAFERPRASLVKAEGVAISGLCKHLGTESQSEPNNITAENAAAAEGDEASLIEEKSITTSGSKVSSDEKGVKEERINDSDEHNSVFISGSVKGGDPDKIKIKRVVSLNIQPVNEKNEVAGLIPLGLNSDGQMIVNASPSVLKGNGSPPGCLIPHLRNSFVGRSYIQHSGSHKEANLTPASLKDRPDSLHSCGWRDERFSTLQDKILLEQGSIRFRQGDLKQFPMLNVESELHKQGGYLASIPYERDSFGVPMIPRTIEKALYGLHHDKHLQAAGFPEDNRLNLNHDFRSAPSMMYSSQFVAPQAIPDREHPTLSSHAIKYGSPSDFQLGTNERDRSLLAPMKPLNLLSESFVSSAFSNRHHHIHRGSFSALTRNAESPGLGSISLLGEVGYTSHTLLAENQLHKGDLEIYDNLRKRKVVTMGWCRICEVDCNTVEGLDLHSQTREHQRMSMDMVLKIKQQNSKRQSMKKPSQDYNRGSMGV